jgi:hypothetical protein
MTTTNLKRLGTKETAARIRTDIKNLQKHGALPAGKFSVRMDSFAGGSSITVDVVDVAAVMFNVDRFIAEKRDPRAYRHDEPRMTAEGERIMALVHKVVNVYHEDKSDIMSDYFNVNFYAHVHANGQEEKERAAFDAAEAAAAEVIDTSEIDAEDERECAAFAAERAAEIAAFAAERAEALAALDAEVATTGVLTLVTEALAEAPVAPAGPSLDAVVAALRALEDPKASLDAKRDAVDVIDGVGEDLLVDAYIAMAA